MNRLVDSSYDGKKESFTYDKVGNRLTKTTNHITEKYVYNVKNQLKEVYREKGNSTQLPSLSKFDVAKYKIWSLTYDKQGNTLKEETTSGTNSFEYNTLNQQVKAITKDGNTLVNRYDAEGLRYEIEENEKLTKFIFHNDEVLVETDESDKAISRFIRGYDVVAADVKDGRYYYSVDEQGSTEFITDVAGKVRNEYRYDAFGNVLKTKEDIHNRITYTGQQFDKVTQQYYLRARFYNPIIGRFTQEDSYRGDGLNLYSYCVNNSVIYYDPSGYAGVGKGHPKKEIQHNTKGVTEAEIVEGKKVVNNRVNNMIENMTEGEKSRTTYGSALVKLEDGTTEMWVSSAGKKGYVPPRIRGNDKVIKNKSLEANSINRFNDAEQTIMREANEVGAEIISIGATRDMCPACQAVAKENGIIDRVATPLKKIKK